MSGGSYDYAYMKIEDMADELCQQRQPLRKAFGKHLKLVAKAMHDIEWVDSSDYGPGEEVDSINAVLAPGAEMEAIKEDLQELIGMAQQLMSSKLMSQQ